MAPLDESRFVELSDSDTERLPHGESSWPLWLDASYLDTLIEEVGTTTSAAQQRTQAVCMPFLMLDDSNDLALNSHGIPHLHREGHANLLSRAMNPMPTAAQASDAARPWIFYWILQGLTAMGQDVSNYRERLITTLRPLQNATGGFAGGHGQNSHCATSYGCVLSLAIVGGLDMIDRKTMWHFLGQVKQADGGFRVAVSAEEDIRGAYCAMTIISLLNLPLELPPDAPARAAGLTSFLDDLGPWISRCQTYEGGIGGAPTNEAHGAYAFCALACLSIIDAPQRSIPKYLDVPALIKWVIDIQTSPEGGFAGRTNKLVDACYSHWVGGCWSLLEAAIQRTSDKPLWNRAGLVRYLLTCCQKSGRIAGMRDKPSARADMYHTCYSLAGLSAATNHYSYQDPEPSAHELDAPYHWSWHPPSKAELEESLIDQDDVLEAVHPVFVIPFEAVKRARNQFKASSI